MQPFWLDSLDNMLCWLLGMVKWKKVEDKFGHSTPLVHTPIFNELNVIELVEKLMKWLVLIEKDEYAW